MSKGDHPNCKLNCCRYKRLQLSISFFEREAKLLRENVETREKLQRCNPDYQPPGLDNKIPQRDLKDKLFKLKIKARAMLAVMKLFRRQVKETQSFFDIIGLKVGPRDWAQEQKEWTAKEALLAELEERFEQQTLELTALQRTVWLKCYAVDWLQLALTRKKLDLSYDRGTSTVEEETMAIWRSSTILRASLKRRPSLLSAMESSDDLDQPGPTVHEQARAGKQTHIAYLSKLILPPSTTRGRWRLS